MKRLICLVFALWVLPVGFANLVGLADGIGVYAYGTVIAVIGIPTLISYLFPKLGVVVAFIWGTLNAVNIQTSKIGKSLYNDFIPDDPATDMIIIISFGLLFALFISRLTIFLKENIQDKEAKNDEKDSKPRDRSVLEVAIMDKVSNVKELLYGNPMYKKYTLIATGVVMLASYPVYSYLEKESMLRDAAQTKLNECLKIKRQDYSIEYFMKKKCPEYLYYIKYCDDKCKEQVINKMKDKF